MFCNKSRNADSLFLPSTDFFQRLKEEVSANDKKSIVIERIRIRESLLKKIRVLFKEHCCIERDLKDILFQMHIVSVSIVEAIIEIESISHREREATDDEDPVTFSWNGETYLLKMLTDGQFICQVPSVVEMLGIETKTLFRNPFLLPLDIDEIIGYDPGGAIEREERMKRVTWEINLKRIKRASQRILFEENRGRLLYEDTVHVTGIDGGKESDFIELPVPNVPTISLHDLDISSKKTFDEALILCCVRLLVDNTCSNEIMGFHIPRRVVLCMNEIKPQDLAQQFDFVAKAGKILISKQLAIAIYSTILRHVLKMDLFKAAVTNRSIFCLRKWLIMVMSKHDYLLGCDAVRGEGETQPGIPTAFGCFTNTCRDSLKDLDDNSGLRGNSINCSTNPSPEGKESALDSTSRTKYIIPSDERAFLRGRIPMPVRCALEVTEGKRSLKVIEGTCQGCLRPGDRIRIGHPFLSRLYHVDNECSQQRGKGEHILIREAFDHTPVLYEEFIDLNEPVALLHNPSLKATTRSRNGLNVTPLLESTKLSTESQYIYDTMTAETICDREPLTFVTIGIWKLVQDKLDSRLEWRKEFDNGLVLWQQHLSIDENCSIPCRFLRVSIDMTLIEQDCRDSLSESDSNIHQQRLQYFERVSLNDIIMETFKSVCNWHPVGSSIDIFKWAKLARRMRFLSKVKNSNHEVDMAFLRHSKHRKLNLTQFRSVLLDMATVRFPSSRYNINVSKQSA